MVNTAQAAPKHTISRGKFKLLVKGCAPFYTPPLTESKDPTSIIVQMLLVETEAQELLCFKLTGSQPGVLKGPAPHIGSLKLLADFTEVIPVTLARPSRQNTGAELMPNPIRDNLHGIIQS